MVLNDNTCKSSLMAKLFQLFSFEAAQDRKRAVFAYQPIVQKKTAHCSIKVISDRMPVQINDEDSAAGHAAHFAHQGHDLLVRKMVREQRTHRVIKLPISERQSEGITTYRG